ncbi:DUF3854 domain-containing protein [Niallia sp. HCP3S3_B10]|uniref:DUF3854 domain-containing protein n=1 Tax=Niallia sp. HCP3S3_B10 TaxID=3438944 RepID=UPI003F8C5DF9
MNSLYRKTKVKGFYEYYRTPCPICGKTGACMTNEDNSKVVCIRVESDIQFSKNSALISYLHVLKEDNRNKVNVKEMAEEVKGFPKKDSITLDTIYHTLLDNLVLDDFHYNHLTSNERKLSDEQITIRNYKSFPDKPWTIVKAISNDIGINDFQGIPGFYFQNGYWSIAGMKGILIPYRNQYNQIEGFQYRIDNPPNIVEVKLNGKEFQAKVIKQPNVVEVKYKGNIIFQGKVPLQKDWSTITDNNEILGWIRVKKGNRYYWLSSANKPNGTGSGNPAPIHVSIPSKKLKNWVPGTLYKAKTVWLGEGALKGDIAVDLMANLYDSLEIDQLGDTFINLPGAGAWRLAIPVLKEMGVQTVNICFDADAIENVYVKKHLLECAKELKKQNFHANLIVWKESDGKGIDDLMLKDKIPNIKRIY